MSLPKLAYKPQAQGYAVDHPNQVIAVKLAGGSSRIRADVEGATSTVSGTWLLNQFDYSAFMQFMIEQTARGALPFLADLVIDFPFPTQYRCQLVPGSMKDNQIQGFGYQVTMQLEVEQVEYFTGTYFFIGPNQIHCTSPVTFSNFLEVTGAVQLVLAGVNDGVHPPVNLDGIYVISSFPAGNIIALSSPSSVNTDWSLLSSYPSSTTPTISPVSVVGIPT